MSLEDWTIEITDGGDLCGSCGDLIENCGDDCPVLQMLEQEFSEKPAG